MKNFLRIHYNTIPSRNQEFFLKKEVFPYKFSPVPSYPSPRDYFCNLIILNSLTFSPFERILCYNVFVEIYTLHGEIDYVNL